MTCEHSKKSWHFKTWLHKFSLWKLNIFNLCVLLWECRYKFVTLVSWSRTELRINKFLLWVSSEGGVTSGRSLLSCYHQHTWGMDIYKQIWNNNPLLHLNIWHMNLMCTQKLPELKLNAVKSVQSLKITVLDVCT